MNEKKINCYKCRHFYVTWDINYPKGCKAYNFKSEEMPSILVKKTSGIECYFYEEKEPLKIK